MLNACNEAQPSSTSATALRFQFSKKAPANELRDENSWCNKPFTEAIVIQADPANENRRYFMLGEGIYTVALQLGNATSSFFLQKAGQQSVDVFTSDNYPYCSSNRANFSPAPDGAWFKYDNGRGITYTVEAQSSAEGQFVILTLPPKPTYGLTVHRCTDCR